MHTRMDAERVVSTKPHLWWDARLPMGPVCVVRMNQPTNRWMPNDTTHLDHQEEALCDGDRTHSIHMWAHPYNRHGSHWEPCIPPQMRLCWDHTLCIHPSEPPSLQVHFIGCARQRRHVQIGAAHPPHIRLPLGTAQPTVILSSAHTFGSRSSITVQAAQKWHPLALTHRLVVQSHLFDQLYTWLPMGALMRCTSQASASTLLSL